MRCWSLQHEKMKSERVSYTALANASIQTRPYCSCCIYLQSGSPSGSPLWKFWHRSPEKPATETLSPSQCLQTPTGRPGPPLAQNGQITTIVLWECSARGKEKLMVWTVKSQSPAEMFHQHWGHCSDESHLEQEVLSKSMQQKNRFDCDILMKCEEKLMMMMVFWLFLCFWTTVFEPVNYICWCSILFYVAQKGSFCDCCE